MSAHPITLHDVLGNVGAHIYRCLRPKDLASLGSCSRPLREEVVRPDKLARICADHLPLCLGAGTNYRAEFRVGRSFSCKEEVLDRLLERAESAGLVFDGANTVEESRWRAREAMLGDGGTSTAKFHALELGSADDLQYSQSGGYNRSGRWITANQPVECEYKDEINRDSATSWARYILNRESFKRSAKDRDTCQFIEEWLACLFSANDNTTFAMWRWSCRHVELYHGEGILGVGVVICVDGDAEGANDGAIVELGLTRIF